MLNASSAANIARTNLVDAVEVRSMDLGQFGDTPKLEVPFEVFVYEIVAIHQKITEPQRLDFTRCRLAYPRGRVLFDVLHAVRHGYPTAGLDRNVYLKFRPLRRLQL